MRKNLIKLVAVSSMIFVTLASYAQGVTGASFFGLVTDQEDKPLAGATVVAKHLPSGSVYGVITRDDGRYNLPQVRIGGPYTVTVTYIGFKAREQNEISLSLGQNFQLNVKMEEENVTLNEVVIAVEKNEILNSQRTGAATNVSNQVINSLPTLSRSLNDFIRLTPQSKSSSVAATAGSGASFAGQDSRFNNLTIDGSIFNNSFGLASAPAGQTNSTPISLDAIEEIQISLAPFDVRLAGFTGAGVNAVTRSGTNQVQGSVFYNTRNESYVGDEAEGNAVVTNNFDIKQYGFRVGGPIIKDKLFFFINGESERRDDPATSFVAARPGLTGNNVTRVRASSLDSLRNFLRENYNYEAGEYENYSLETFSDKFLIKLDWNASKNNRFAVRFNYLKSYRDVLASQSGAFSGRRDNLFSLNFSNSNYIINNDIYSGIIEWNSIIGSRLFSNFQVGYTANRDYRSSGGGVFPLVDILEGGRNYTAFGYEPFTPNNRLDTDTWQVKEELTYYAGKHTIVGGVNFESFTFENTFTPTYYGQFVFNSLNDFYRSANGDAGVQLRRYQLTYSALPNSALPTATTEAGQIGLFIQDEFPVLKDRMRLTLGLRGDIPFFGNTALENPVVTAATFKDAEGNPVKYNTADLPKAHLLFSPRVGFNWDVKGDRSLQVRGGTGIFSARPAFVWISNQVGNNGILTGQIFTDNTTAYPFSPDVNQYIPANATTPATFNIAVSDPDFKFPQVWRSNLAVDKKLPWGFVGTLEGIFTQKVNDVNYINANLEPATASYAGPDNRPIYPGFGLSGGAQAQANRVVDQITDATVLQNTNEGYTYSLTAKLERQFANGIYTMLAYNFSEAQDLITAGSIAFSSWRDNRTVLGNNRPDLAFSDFDQRNRIVGAISYRKEYAKLFASQLSIFLQSGNQGRYSYTINGDINGDQIFGNDLLYIPRDASEITFEQYTEGGKTYTADDQSRAFQQFIDNEDYLSENRGSYAERNGALLPWLTTIDLAFVQEVGFKVGETRQRFQFRADIYNFGNLLNSDWGVGDSPTNTSPVQFRSRNATTNTPVYRFSTVRGSLPTEPLISSNSLSDVWQLQLGVRYIFN